MSAVIEDREYVRNVCKLGQGAACCRYLAASARGLECLKHTGLKAELDRRAAAKTMHAQSDNCEGKSDEDRAV
jgi:hypothetical protein